MASAGRLAAVVVACLGVAGCNGCDGGLGGGKPPPPPAVVDASRGALSPQHDTLGDSATRVVYLDQGWSPEQSAQFYWTTQGSHLVPYSWALALEQHDKQEPFFSEANVQRLRYLPQTKTSENPDGLPVGFVKDGELDWLGLTCAACHTGQINFRGTAIRIDGGPALGDVQQLLTSLALALETTLENDEKFERFAAKVLAGRAPTVGGDAPAAPGAEAEPADPALERQILKLQLQYVLGVRQGYNQRNMPKDEPHRFGYGRVDAFGAILNEVLERALGIPDNHQDADAPVSYPFLWDTPHHDVVQWNGSAPNANFGDLARNVGEVLGVFAELEIPQSPSVFGYPSTARVGKLRELERLLHDLRSPQWPDLFPPIDAAKKAQGQTLFGEYCARCHEAIDRSDPNRRIVARMSDTGTDPRMAANFRNRTALSGRLEGMRKFLVFGDALDQTAPGEDILVNAVFGAIVHSPFSPPEDRLTKIREMFIPRAAAVDPSKNLYKARPLNGIWATAPYLHNGSVPNLYQILLPAGERDKQFHVGRREFDAVDVGFVRDAFEGSFLFRTRDDEGQPIPGNSNAGHEYGTGLAEEAGGDGKPALDETQRRALLEYLKSL